MKYPPTTKIDVTETLHGVEVADPYRWLEDLDSPETKSWIEAQNSVTSAYLETLKQRDAIRDRLKELWNYEKFGGVVKRENRYFLLRNEGLWNHFALYVLDGKEGEPRLLLDPNTWSDDGTVALVTYFASRDGRYVAYAKSAAGSDWQEWRVINVDTAEDEPDHLRWIKFSGASWLPDGSGFFYSRYDEPKQDGKLEDVNYYQKLYFHKLGTDQAQDLLILKRDDQKEWGFWPQVTDDGRFLVIAIWKGTHPENAVFYVDLQGAWQDIVELIPDFRASWQFIGNDERRFLFKTDLRSPKGRVIEIDLDEPNLESPRELIAESDDKLELASWVGDRLFGLYWQDAKSLVKVFKLDGLPDGSITLPGPGTVVGFGGRAQDRETFFIFTSFNTPGTIYRYDLDTRKSEVFRAPQAGFDTSTLQVEQVFYPSKDGTKIPMFIVHKDQIELNGDHPTLLYGYGGFNIPMTPAFAISIIHWIEMGGVYAQACLRGGGEYGEEWHQAGALNNKQNVFDDFVSAAEWLVENKYTSRKRLAIVGGSNGGLLVGACMTQRPELFGAVVCSRGVLDMLRFHKFTIGWAWVSDYGTPEEPEDFKVLYSYSPLHNIRKGTSYPATLITTADHDDRVVPSHSFKFASALQEAQGGEAPILIRVETKAGHGMGTPTEKLIEELADSRAFLHRALNI